MSVLQTNDHNEKLDLENHNLRINLSEKTKENEELQKKCSKLISAEIKKGSVDEKDQLMKDELRRLKEFVQQQEVQIRNFELENEAIRLNLSESIMIIEQFEKEDKSKLTSARKTVQIKSENSYESEHLKNLQNTAKLQNLE